MVGFNIGNKIKSYLKKEEKAKTNFLQDVDFGIAFLHFYVIFGI